MRQADEVPANPHYGQGVYRRRIRIRNDAGRVHATLFDDYHDMACVLSHDGKHVTAMHAEIHRAPFSTCGAATIAIQDLVGLRLDATRRELYGHGRPQRNCTHIFDLAVFALGHARQDASMTTLDFIVPDVTAAGSQIEAHRDGVLLHGWLLGEDETIIAPVEYAGQAIFGGFTAWAEKQFDGVCLELALHLQKVVLVARGRRNASWKESEESLRNVPVKLGVCYTFTEPQFSKARPNRDYVRDFTAGMPERAER
jgi:hypothetical protein